MKVIFATDASGVFSRRSTLGLPWPKHEPDLAMFKILTKNHIIIMGRKTFESLPALLPGRKHFVISKTISSAASFSPSAPVSFFSSLEEAISKAYGNLPIAVIGGLGLIEEAISKYSCTIVWSVLPFTTSKFGDEEYVEEKVFETRYCRNEEQEQTYNSIFSDCNLYVYTRKTEVLSIRPSSMVSPSGLVPKSAHQEYQYLDLAQRILNEGVKKVDRTGVGTLSIFGPQIEFDISNSFPLLTTKRMFWKGVVEELLWFLRGSTNSKELSAQGVNIWKGNTSREYLDRIGLKDYPEGEAGCVYGHQWRNFGGDFEIKDGVVVKGNNGIDQLSHVIHLIKTNPDSRRLVVSAWNPTQITKMCLPPCHMCFEFYVSQGELSCKMFQRSADVFLGLPMNIASYALLTYIVAKICGLKPGKLIITIGDAHIYLNHVEQMKLQLTRDPKPWPTLRISLKNPTPPPLKSEGKANVTSEGLESFPPKPPSNFLDTITSENIYLFEYQHHPTIRGDMAV